MQPAFRRINVKPVRPARVKDEYRISEDSYIYIIKCNEYVKIGKSDYVEERLKLLQTGNPYRLELLFKFKCDNSDLAMSTEAHLHRHFSKKHHAGEWFKLTKSDINSIKSIIKEAIG